MIPGRVLVIAPQWVGDAIQMLPGLEAAKQAWPEARFTLYAKAGICGLFEASPIFDERLAQAPAGYLARFMQMAGLRQQAFDLALVYPPSFSSALSAWISGAKLRVGRGGQGRWLWLNRSLPQAERSRRATLEYLDLPEAAGAPVDARQLSLRLPLSPKGLEERARIFHEHGLQPGATLIALCPTSAWPSKRWPAARWTELASRLKAERYQPVFFCAPSELPDVQGLAQGAPVLAPSLAGLAACLASCGGVLANDSGPLHLAAALGLKGLGLFGPVSPAWSAPLSASIKSLYRAEPCSPCHQAQCPLGHQACLKEMQVDQVWAALREALAA